MNSVQKKLQDLERLKKEMSDKLDKYEYNINKNNEKIDLSILKKEDLKNNNAGGKNFRQIMNQRLDEIMGKIDDNIINQNYSNFYKFLSKASPYQKIKSQKIIQNPEINNNNINKNNNILKSNNNQNNNNEKVSEIKEQENSEENYDDFNNEEEINKIENEIPKEKKEKEEKEKEKQEKEEKEKIVEERIEKKEKKNDNLNNEKKKNKIENEIPKEDKRDKEEKERKKFEKEEKEKIVEEIIEKKEIKNESNNDNENFDENYNNNTNISNNKLKNNRRNEDIHISYNGTGKIDLEELKSKQNLELLHKQQNIFLSNELTLLKCKLNKIRKDNEFLQSLIHEKGMVKNTNVLEKFIGKFVERLSLNWDEIVNMIIDEILIDEAYELNNIDLKKINYEKNKKKLIKNLVEAGFGGIAPENENKDLNTHMDLIIENIDYIQKTLNNVKQTEKSIKMKYNIK